MIINGSNIQIYFDDLNEENQEEIKKFLGDDIPYQNMPIAVLEVERQNDCILYRGIRWMLMKENDFTVYYTGDQMDDYGRKLDGSRQYLYEISKAALDCHKGGCKICVANSSFGNDINHNTDLMNYVDDYIKSESKGFDDLIIVFDGSVNGCECVKEFTSSENEKYCIYTANANGSKVAEQLPKTKAVLEGTVND